MAEKYGKDITSIEGGITFNLPDGTTKQFNTSKEAQKWFNENYGEGYSMQEHTQENVQENTPQKAANKSDFASRFYGISDWESLFGNTRVKGLQRNPDAVDNFQIAQNVGEFVNLGSAGLLNRLSPTQNIGWIIDLAKGKNVINSWFGNSGIVSDNFAEEHPYWSLGINFLGDAGSYAAWNRLSQNLNFVAKLRHPTYKKYYHGTSADFDITQAKMGSTTDLGLHVSDAKRVADSMVKRGGGTNPHVEEFWAPRPSTETIDIWGNGIKQLTENYPLEARTGPSGYVTAGDNNYLFKLIREQGGIPTMEKPGGLSPRFQLDKSVSLNLRKSNYPKIPKSEYPRIDKLLDEYNTLRENPLIEGRADRMREINTEGAKILSDNGYKVIKYNNMNVHEGGGGASYIITDPSVIYQPKPLPTLDNLYMFRPINLDNK